MKHRITWWVYTGERNADGSQERIRVNATMRGRWPGYDVQCSCGWETQTGGATRRYIQQEVWYHKHIDSDGPQLP